MGAGFVGRGHGNWLSVDECCRSQLAKHAGGCRSSLVMDGSLELDSSDSSKTAAACGLSPPLSAAGSGSLKAGGRKRVAEAENAVFGGLGRSVLGFKCWI
jgi:hypothetical protein